MFGSKRTRIIVAIVITLRMIYNGQTRVRKEG